MPSLTHEDLRKMAVKWLTNTQRCSAVVSEIVTYSGEIPDAIGWRGATGGSVLVECKASRSDWLANKNKCHVRAGRGAGRQRYILCPEGMIRPDEITDGYGLLYAYEHGIRVKKQPEPREPHWESEVMMLVSALRRVKAREFLVLCQCDHEQLEAPHA